MIGINNTTRQSLDLRQLKKIIKKFLKENDLADKEVSIALVGEKRIRELNKQYRHKDQITDILSFEGEGDFLGELIICLNQIKRQAVSFSPDFWSELNYILVHGLFHLLGYDDRSERGRKEMNKLTDDFLDSFYKKNGKTKKTFSKF